MLIVFISIVWVLLAAYTVLAPRTTDVVLVLLITFVSWVDCVRNAFLLVVRVRTVDAVRLILISTRMRLTARVPMQLIMARVFSFVILC